MFVAIIKFHISRRYLIEKHVSIHIINHHIMAYNIIEIVGASQNMEFALYAWGSSLRTLNSRNLIRTDS